MLITTSEMHVAPLCHVMCHSGYSLLASSSLLVATQWSPSATDYHRMPLTGLNASVYTSLKTVVGDFQAFPFGIALYIFFFALIHLVCKRSDLVDPTFVQKSKLDLDSENDIPSM